MMLILGRPCDRLYNRLALLLTLAILLLELSTLVQSHEAEEDNTLGIAPRPEWRRRRRKNSECRLGGQWYPINSTWSPNLGPPFGVWNCVQCTCKLVQKKRRRVARVECHNMKSSCEEVRCANPVLLPGSCCKTCPSIDQGGLLSPLLRDPLPRDSSAHDITDDSSGPGSGNDFAVLLNGRTSLSPVTSPHVATGRLSLRRSTLHFSFLLSPSMMAPSVLRFMNSDGEVLEELEAQSTPFTVNNNRVCGTWTRMPKQYRQLLRTEGLWVSLVPPDSDEADLLSGRIARYVGVDTEVFSALLTHRLQLPVESGASRLPGGGTAVVSVDSRSESLHISLVFNGIFPSGGSSTNTSVILELSTTRSGEVISVRDTVVLQKEFTDINTVEVLTTLGESSLPSLTRGKVNIKLWAAGAPGLAIEGVIAARATCNVFSAVLTTSRQEGSSGPMEGERFGAGWAVVALTDEGFFNYQVEVVPSIRVARVSLVALRKRKERVVHDITDSYNNGFANGTYLRPTYGDLDALMRGRLQVLVSSDGSPLEGVLQVQPITEAVRSNRPTLIRSVGVQWAATAWVAVDSDCVMHYHVQLAGATPLPSWQLVLQEKDETFDPRLVQQRVVLEEYVEGSEVADHTTHLTPASLSRLHQGGVSLLEMLLFDPVTSDEDLPGALLTADLLDGRLEAINVPQHCRLDAAAGGPVRPVACGLNCLNTIDVERSRMTKCIDEEKNVYEDGASWRSRWSHCQQCMCTRGTINCMPEVCPTAQCDSQIAMTMPSQCCAMCPRTEEERRYRGPGCAFSNQSHPVGSQWHPFLPPIGFERCVICTCTLGDNGRPKLDCQRKQCPPLLCPEVEAVRREGECCKSCPVVPSATGRRIWSPNSNEVMNDEQRRMKEQEALERLLKEGGCAVKGVVRSNGEEWHPRIPPGGVYRCVRCSCKDGGLSCIRRRCTDLQCSRRDQPLEDCCEECLKKGGKRRKGGKRSRKKKLTKSSRTRDSSRRGRMRG